MHVKVRKAVILDYLPALHIHHLCKHFSLQRLGTSHNVLSVQAINPVTGKRQLAISVTGTVNIDIGVGNDYIDLQLSDEEIETNQRIELIACKSNLGKGNVYFFRCGKTGKRTRVIYWNGQSFVSRYSLGHVAYSCQLEPMSQKVSLKRFRRLRKDQEIAKQINTPYFTKYYGGNLTKRYMGVLDAVDSLNRSW